MKREGLRRLVKGGEGGKRSGCLYNVSSKHLPVSPHFPKLLTKRVIDSLRSLVRGNTDRPVVG